MGCHKNRDPLAGKAADELPEMPPRDGVDAGGGLVQEKDLRSVKKRTGKRQALPPPGRKLTGEPVPHLLQACLAEGPADTLAPLALGDAIDPQVEADVLDGC